MALKADNSNLPKAQTEGNPPNKRPVYGQLLAQAWEKLDAEGEHTKSRTDVPRYIRLGWAGQCARLIGYRLLETPASNPPDLAAIWRMNLGTMVHEGLQETIVAAYPGAEIEKVVGVESDELFGFPVSGRSDVFLVDTRTEPIGDEHGVEGVTEVYERYQRRVLIEVKTINGFGFKMAVGARGAAEGPRTGAIFQAALNGRAHGADEVVVLYLSLECLSDRELEQLVKKTGGEADPIRKFVAEWSWPMAELDEMVDKELARLGKIVDMIDARVEWESDVAAGREVTSLAMLPPRSIPFEMPARARVVDPMTGRWEVQVEGNVMDAGTAWMCKSYCDQRDNCARDGAS